ncbi:MAG: hypothetical protein WHT65_00790 [Pseudothermotoga sp.]
MLRRMLLVVILLLATFLVAEQFKRTIEERIEIQQDGSAIITRTETIPESELAKFYIEHYENMLKDKSIFKFFLYEFTKEYYFLYGTTPTFSINQIEASEKNGFKWTITMKAQGLLRSDENGHFIFSRKGFGGNEKLAEQLLPKYFESQIDDKLFTSAFLKSEKNSLQTVRYTEVILPEGSKIENITPEFFVKRKFEETMKVDFGAGNNYSASFDRTDKGYALKEVIVTNGGKPEKLLDSKSSSLVLNDLKDYTAFKVVFWNGKMKPETLSKPVEHEVKNDFSGNWSFSVSSGELLSYTFTYGTLSVTPKITVTLTFNVSLLWEHEWVRTGWFSWSYRFKKFESVVSLTPSFTPSLTVSSGGNISRNWSRNLFTKSKTITFWVGTVPVILVLEAKLDAEATAQIYGSIGFTVSATYSLTTSLKITYQNGSWSKTPSYTTNYSGINFQANAKIGADAIGKLPFTLTGYVYYVAGPFVRLTPWIEGTTNASVGSSNQVGYTIKGGLTATGGVQMSGWLQSLCGGIPSISYDFFTWPPNGGPLASGTYTF